MTVIPIAEWRPDLPDLAEATSLLQNAIPVTVQSYGPASSLAPFSNAMDGVGLGAISVADVDQSVHLFSGTADNLYHIAGGSTTWANVSVSPGAYAVNTGDSWRFARFNRMILATDYNDPIQFYQFPSSTNFAALSAGAPKARHIAAVKNFAFAANTNDPVSGQMISRVWWSGFNDPTNWPTPGTVQAQTVQSGYNDFPGSQGGVTGIVTNTPGMDAVLFFERGVYSVTYSGPPGTFDFFPIQGALGTRAPNSIIQVGALVFYLAEDGFYMFNGSFSQPIGNEKVDRWFLNSLNTGYLYNVIGAADIRNKLVMWLFPSVNSSGAPDTILFYKWDIQRWGFASIAADWIMPALSFGVSLDNFPAFGYPNLDTVPFSLDSPVWVGGALQIAAIKAGVLSYFTGTPLQAIIGTQVAQLTKDKRTMVQSVRPLVDSSAATVALSARVNYYDAETFGPAVAVNNAGECPQRSDGRYHRAAVTIPANAMWTHCFGIDVTATDAGTR